MDIAALLVGREIEEITWEDMFWLEEGWVSVNFGPMGEEGVIQVFDERIDAGFPLPFAEVSGRCPEVVRVMIGINRSQESVELVKKAVSITLIDLFKSDRNHVRDDRVFFFGGAKEPSQEEELGANQDRVG